MSEVPPTRMNQQVYKAKLKAAQGGHKLLKKKADALKVSNISGSETICNTAQHIEKLSAGFCS